MTGSLPITIYSENRSLCFAWEKKYEEIENQRILRIFEKMSHLDITFKYVKGESNSIPDALSRYQVDEMEGDAPDLPRDYTQSRQLYRVATRSETWTIPADIKQMIETAKESESYAKCLRFIRGEEDLKKHPDVEDLSDMIDISIDETFGGALI